MTALFLKKEKSRRQHFISVPVFSLICVLSFSFVALSYAFFDIRLNLASTGGMEGVQAFFQDNHHYEMEPEGFWTKGSESAVIFLHSLTPLKEMSLLLSRPLPGIIYIQVGNRKITSAIAWPAEAKKLIFRSLVDFPWRGGHLYFVKVRAESSFIPSDLDEKNPDNRSLGIFVKVAFLCGK